MPANTRSDAARTLAGLRRRGDVRCGQCGTTFQAVIRSGTTAPRHCSDRCRQRAHRQRKKAPAHG